MKKIVLFALACASIFGTSTATAQEVTYVEDCSQGLLLNKMKDNWFIGLQGGPSVNVNKDFDRIGATVGLYGGKWFTPVFGARIGVNALLPTGKANYNYYDEKYLSVGPELDLLINLTNWWCGYKQNRIYNAVLHGGAGGYLSFVEGDHIDNTLFMTLGLQNNFAVSKQVDLFLDIQGTLVNPKTGYLSAQVGFTYKFNKRDWNCPITAVCPTWKYTDAEGDALVARLANSDKKIKDLQRQLDECLNRPEPECEEVDRNLATIYYPINVSTLTKREQTLVYAVAEEMKKNPENTYVLTGWADNYTGTDEYNAKIRQARVENVKKLLVKAGVSESQLEITTNAGALSDLGEKGAQFDRAVTVQLKK